MSTEFTRQIVYARVRMTNKTRVIKVIKLQIFAKHNKIKHHLIGNLYFSVLRNIPIEIIEEVAYCKIQPIILTKFTFRHTPRKKKQSIFKHKLNLKDY